jgi:hypothetical protein
MAETAVASTITPTLGTAITYTIGPVSGVNTAAQVFNPLFGYRISDPLVLPGTPVTGSVLRWSATVPAGSTVTVETSINNGASWDLAVNNGPVPRLLAGDTVTRAVLTRVTLTRASAVGAKPTVASLEVQVSCDAAVDELVDLAHGVIAKATVKTTTGSGGSSGSSGGGGVTSRGGGQTGGGTNIKIHAVDLSRSAKLAQWEQPFFVPTGMTYGEAAKLMLLNRIPNHTEFNIASTEHLVKDLMVFGLNQGGDPWQDIMELAAAAGCEVFFDPSGVFVFRPIPDPRYGAPVWTFDEDADPTFTEADKELSDDPVRNYIVVKGEATSSQNPVSAYAFDADPLSPTYVGGKLGKRVSTVTIQSIVTQEQAQAAANGYLYNSLGLADQVTMTCVPMPALEPGDIVKVKIGDLAVDGLYLINRATTPISQADSQELVCYRQTANIAA